MKPIIFSDWRDTVRRFLDALVLLAGACSLFCLLAIIGWELSGDWRRMVNHLTTIVLWIFVLQEAIRISLELHPWTFVRRHWAETLLALFVLLEVLLQEKILSWFQPSDARQTATLITLGYLGASLLTLLAAVGLRVARGSTLLSARGISPGTLLIASFSLVIGAGTLLLQMPKATVEPISWLDALFTSTSAVCVTGLIVVDTATRFTLTGQIIIMALIQIGGLGVMTWTYFFAHYLAGGVSLKDRILLQDLLSEENVGQITSALLLIMLVTFGIELVGAAAIHFFLPTEGLPSYPVFSSFFHSISAFCNAGFSIYSQGLAEPVLRENTSLQFVIAALIILGGLGFPVYMGLWRWSRARKQRRRRAGLPGKTRLSTHTRLALSTTFILLVAGTGLSALFQFGLHEGVHYTSIWTTSFFNSVTARTAGFNVTPLDDWTPAMIILVIILMYVGGNPGGTAGGIKTTTFALGLMNIWKIMREGRDLECFNRRISQEIINRAFAISSLALLWIMASYVILCALHPEFGPLDLLFEAVSAFGTVGLTRGLTPQLSDPAKIVIILNMFVGRVGILVFLFAFLRGKARPAMTLPEDKIIVG